MNILHISAECYPVAKVGGLADVVGALPKYQNNKEDSSAVVMPFYNNKFTQNHSFSSIYNAIVNLGTKEYNFDILTLDNSALGFEIFFVDIKELLFTDFVYSNDDTNRFLGFQIAVLDWILTRKSKPDILHCHDHHTGLIPFMTQECYEYVSLSKIPIITTIHNAQYQGWFNYDKLNLIPEFNTNNIGLLDWNGTINPLAAAIKCAWRVTTVSPTYMEELQINANGLESLLASENSKCIGILNGIDTEVWNPETDDFIIKNFNIKTIASGRKSNKKWLCDEFNLDFNKPLFAFIGRLVGEKGADLLPKACSVALQKKNLSMLILGSGFKQTETELENLKDKCIGNYNAYIGYNEKLSHIVYAGADFLLMPSRVEPCGLNQMYSLRYGTIPIVRRIGGLKDTVVDIGDNGFGICHDNVTVDEIVHSISRATTLFENKEQFETIRKTIMTIDHSWDASAKEYNNLYHSINQSL